MVKHTSDPDRTVVVMWYFCRQLTAKRRRKTAHWCLYSRVFVFTHRLHLESCTLKKLSKCVFPKSKWLSCVFPRKSIWTTSVFSSNPAGQRVCFPQVHLMLMIIFSTLDQYCVCPSVMQNGWKEKLLHFSEYSSLSCLIQKRSITKEDIQILKG